MNATATIIDYKNFGKTYKDIQEEETQRERNNRLEYSEEITEEELNKILIELGYKISNSMSFNYYNTGNPQHYKARSIYIIDIKTKQSFAHFEQEFTNRENQEKLQKVRRNYFVFSKGRIWDL